MSDNIGLIGCGAVGSYVGAYLTQSGENITLIDMWPEHVQTMKDKGLRASGSQGDFTVPVNAIGLTEAQSLREKFDYAFICVKSYDTEWATHFIKRFVKEEGYFVGIQNCWNDPVIGSVVGSENALGCIASNIEYIAQKLDVIDLGYATDNLWGERWTKLCMNGMGNAISAMTQMGSQDMAADPTIRHIRIHLAKEGTKVGLAQGLNILNVNSKSADIWADADNPETYEELDEHIASSATSRVNWLASMAQDVYKKRKSEVEQMNGLIVEKGIETNIQTPYHNAIVEVMKDVDAGIVEPSKELADRVLKIAQQNQ